MARSKVELFEQIRRDRRIEGLSIRNWPSGIGTNLPFCEWGSVFGDPRLVAAIVDRVTNARTRNQPTRTVTVMPNQRLDRS